MKNNRGITLVELLAVIIILSLVLNISIPIIITTIENIRRDSFASAARMMIASTKLKVSEDVNIKMPVNNNDATIIRLNYLGVDNIDKDIDGGSYNRQNSYVLIVKINNELFYYVTLQGSRRNVNLLKEGTISRDRVRAGTSVTLPRSVNSTYTSTELGEPGSFNVTVRYYY